MLTIKGTYRYMAPEVRKLLETLSSFAEGFTEADVFSLGEVLNELLAVENSGARNIIEELRGESGNEAMKPEEGLSLLVHASMDMRAFAMDYFCLKEEKRREVPKGRQYCCTCSLIL